MKTQAIRNSYSVIAKKYAKIGEKIKDKTGKERGKVRLTQSSLLLMVAISANTDNYIFPILETDNPGTTQAEEIRLNQNDEFISYEVGYYLVADGVSDGGFDGEIGKSFWTYAPIELDGSFGQLAKAWNAILSIEVNKISRLERWDLKKHNVIPRTQYANAFAAADFTRPATQPSIDFSTDGTYPMQPMLTLSGAKKNLIEIELLGGAIVATAAGVWTLPDTDTMTYTATRLALTFRGLLGQNASVFQ